MKIVKWLLGTLLAVVVLALGVGTYRSVTALPAPPPQIDQGTLTFAEGVEGIYEAGDLKVVLGGDHGIEVFNKGAEVFKGPKGAPFVWVGGGSSALIGRRALLILKGAQDVFLPDTEVAISCPDLIVREVVARNSGVRLLFSPDCRQGHVRYEGLERFWRWLEGMPKIEGKQYLYISTTLEGTLLRIIYPLAVTDLTESELKEFEDGPGGTPYPLYAIIGSKPEGEPVFGGGEQFSYAALNGKYVPLITAEQGVGRGDQPISALVNAIAPGASGADTSTYAPMGFFATRNASYYLGAPYCWVGNDECKAKMGAAGEQLFSTNAFTALDLRADDRFVFWFHDYHPAILVNTGKSPLLGITGLGKSRAMRPLPNWIGQGAVLGIQGGTEIVRAKVKAAQAAGVPLAGVWLQDWQGQRRIDNSDRLWWNWVLDRTRYPEWEKLVADLKADGIQVMLYINPYLVDVEKELPGQRNLYAEAREGRHLAGQNRQVSMPEHMRQPKEIVSGSIKAGVVALHDEETKAWMVKVISENLIGIGALGFMADFGEAYPSRWADGHFHDGDIMHHNQYPVEWAKTVRQAIDAAPNGDQIVAFHRSGFTDSPRYATAFWAGDQLVTWGQHDGFKSAITAMMTSGISGMAYNHTDIGGYTTVVTPFTNIRRSKELFQRWAEFAAFTPIFRTHEGNQPQENHQFDSDAETLQHFGKMAKLFACLQPYRQRLMAQHSATGAPLMRHPWLHYPDDARFHPMTYQQMMLGEDIMVVPVSNPGQSQVAAYLPDEGWEHFWSGKVYGVGDHPIAAPLGQPAFFVRPASAVKRELAACQL